MLEQNGLLNGRLFDELLLGQSSGIPFLLAGYQAIIWLRCALFPSSYRLKFTCQREECSAFRKRSGLFLRMMYVVLPQKWLPPMVFPTVVPSLPLHHTLT